MGRLHRYQLTPDVVLLFGKAGQMLILSEASQQVEGGLPPAMGRPACAIVPQALNTGRAALSLGCCGARAYLDVLTDEVALWAIPGAKLDRLRGAYYRAGKSQRRSANFPPDTPQRSGEWRKAQRPRKSLAAMASSN